MDCNTYRKLPAAEQLQIWQQLEETVGWQVLKSKMLENLNSYKDVENADDREAFYFKKAKESGVWDVLNFPSAQTKAINHQQNLK